MLGCIALQPHAVNETGNFFPSRQLSTACYCLHLQRSFTCSSALLAMLQLLAPCSLTDPLVLLRRDATLQLALRAAAAAGWPAPTSASLTASCSSAGAPCSSALGAAAAAGCTLCDATKKSSTQRPGPQPSRWGTPQLCLRHPADLGCMLPVHLQKATIPGYMGIELACCQTDCTCSSTWS